MPLIIKAEDCPFNFNFVENLTENFQEFKDNWEAAAVNGKFKGEEDALSEFKDMWETLKSCNTLDDLLVSFPLDEICLNYADQVIGGRWEAAEFLFLTTEFQFVGYYVTYLLTKDPLGAEIIKNSPMLTEIHKNHTMP